jgi:hypothetical protein
MVELFSKYGQTIKIRRAWIKTIIEWARKENSGRFVIAITMNDLISGINNDTNYEEFKKQYFQKGLNNL